MSDNNLTSKSLVVKARVIYHTGKIEKKNLSLDLCDRALYRQKQSDPGARLLYTCKGRGGDAPKLYIASIREVRCLDYYYDVYLSQHKMDAVDNDSMCIDDETKRFLFELLSENRDIQLRHLVDFFDIVADAAGEQGVNDISKLRAFVSRLYFYTIALEKELVI